MSFVLDNSVSMRWYFGDGTPEDLNFAEEVLDASYLELALRKTLSLATLDEKLGKASKKAGVKPFSRRDGKIQ